MMNKDNPIPPQDGDQAIELMNVWSRHVAGETLTEVDRQRLQVALRDDLSFRQLVLDDQWIDHLLRLESNHESTADTFVTGVMMRCQEIASDIQSAHSHNVATLPLIAPQTAGQTPPPLPPHLSARAHVDPQFQLSRLQLQQSPLRPGGDKRARGSASRDAWGWFSAAAVLLISVASFGLWYRAGGLRVAQPQDDRGQAIETKPSGSAPPANRPENVAEPTSPIFATVTGYKPLADDGRSSQAELPFKVGTAFGEQTIALDEGELQVTMASGVVVDLFAPSRLEFTSENSLAMTSGELSACVPSSAKGFQVATPSIVVTDLGTVFDVAVDDGGTTDVEVRRGSVTVASREKLTQQRWHLHEDDVYQLTFYAPPMPSVASVAATNRQPPLMPDSYPIASLARSQAGETSGVISLGGRSMKFDDEVAFSTVRDHVFRGVQESPEQITESWKQFVEAKPSLAEPSGAITLNGVEFAFSNFNEAIRTQNRMRGELQDPDAQSPPEEKVSQPQMQNFRGTLIINGQQRTFESAEEYNAAMKELLGPAAQFGFKFAF